MLFISHDLMSIEKLCDRVALKNHGQLIVSGPPSAVVGTYQEMVATGHAAALADASRVAADARAPAIDWFYGRTMLSVEPGKSVRGYFSTPHDWRIVAGHGREDHGAGL